MPDTNGEPTNAERAARILPLFALYDERLGEVHEEPDMLRLACVLADVRHYCDAHGINYHAAEALSHEHYLDEVQR